MPKVMSSGWINHSSLADNKEFFHMKVKGSQHNASRVSSTRRRNARSRSREISIIQKTISEFLKNPDAYKPRYEFYPYYKEPIR